MCCKGPFKNRIETFKEFPKSREVDTLCGYKLLRNRKSLFRNFTWTPGQFHMSNRFNTELSPDEVLSNTVEKGFHSYIHLFDVPISKGNIIFKTRTPIIDIVCSGKDNYTVKDTIVSNRTFLERIGIYVNHTGRQFTKILFLDLNFSTVAVPIIDIDNITPESFNYTRRMYERYMSQLLKATEKAREVFTFV